MQHQELTTVLLVEDDKLVRDVTREFLQKSHFVILEAVSVQRGLEIARQHTIDAVLLDLHLDGDIALPSIPHFKAIQDVPVLVVSGEQDDKKKILSFELGADDFIEKPFNPELLAARLQSHIKKTQTVKPGPVKRKHFGKWCLDDSRMQLTDKNGQSAGLSLGEYRVLQHMIAHTGEVVQRQALCEALRKGSYVPTPRAIDIKITRLRKKIGQTAEDASPIKTVRGVGYIFDSSALND